ncbi:hypothetical protein MLD38_040096 [Melastoma candidum]|uniref:Uncharacterized protein n=1 Tax=Melastoma candidum TaxID=119954 RepID=A0ACB9L5F0_9MYRT|nr:hypothetical protein MLD38_040096 [Melastoma candidum]
MTTPLPALPSPIPSSARAPLSGVQFSLACETSAEAFEDLSIITLAHGLGKSKLKQSIGLEIGRNGRD